MGRFQTVALAEHHASANSISTLDKLWKQSGFRGTAATAKTIGKFDQRCVRRHSTGRSGFDWSAQLARPRGSTVFVMVHMTNGLAESGENLVKVWVLVYLFRDCDLSFICMGDWNVAPEEMKKTELVGSVGAVMKTPLGVEFTCSSGNRQVDYALVDRRLESVVIHGGTVLGSPVEVACCFGNQCPRGTSHLYKENCVHPRGTSSGLERKMVPHSKDHMSKPNEKRGANTANPCGFTRMQNCAKQARKLGALYQRWPAAAEGFMTTSEPGITKSCVGRITMMTTRTVPILLHVAKDESHVGAREARIGAGVGSRNHAIDGLRHSGMGERTRLDGGSSHQDCVSWLARWTCPSAARKIGHGELSTWKRGLTRGRSAH